MRHRQGPYGQILEVLDDDYLYTAASIVMLARDHGLLAGKEPAQIEMQRARILLGHQARSRDFPAEGDGQVSGTPAWLGRRWKDAYGTT